MANTQRTAWDNIYASGGYEKEPDEELVSLCASISPGKALDAGAGEGRHALWLATHGWDVQAFDISTEGIANLRRQAEKHDLPVETSVGTMLDHEFPIEAFDLVVSTGSALNFFRKSETKTIIEKLKSAARPGGLVYISLSAVDDPAYQRHRSEAEDVEDDSFWSPKTNCWINAFQPGELRECFADGSVLSYAEKTIHDTHGTPHDHVLAFLAARR